MQKMTMAEKGLIEICQNLMRCLGAENDKNYIGGELLSREEVMKRVGITRATLLNQINACNFPAPILVAGQQRWPAKIINDFIIETNDKLSAENKIIAEAISAIKGLSKR